MLTQSRWSRIVLVVGLILFIAGVVDPLEGSVVILAGSLIVLAALFFGRAEKQDVRYWLWVTVAIGSGVGLMFYWSALGGIGGRSGHSIWWILTLLPYPLGWVAGIRWLVTLYWKRQHRPATT
jgi:hypothetical protein